MKKEDNRMKYLAEILAEMGIMEVFDETTELEELAINSLQMMEMIVRIEEKFDISIDDDDLIGENFETIGSVLKMVEKYLK